MKSVALLKGDDHIIIKIISNQQNPHPIQTVEFP